MSMQPYQPNSIEHQKQQVRKNSRNTAIALGAVVVSVPLMLVLDTAFLLVAIIAGIAAVYYGLKVRKTISGKPDQGQLY